MKIQPKPYFTLLFLVAWIMIATMVDAADLELMTGTKGPLLLDEKFDGKELPEGWTIKSGSVRIVDGALRASQNKEDGRLCLFNRQQPMQDAAIQVDFKFDGGRGINISVNPSPGELSKHGHLYSVMITPNMWNITEHNDKADRDSQSKKLSSAAARFEHGKWYTLLIESKGPDVVARVAGKEPLRASSPDFKVKKPGIEFRVIGPTGENVSFDNLRVWELR